MRNIGAALGGLAIILAGFSSAGLAQTLSQNPFADLGGTSRQLVKFLGSDAVLTPQDVSKQTQGAADATDRQSAPLSLPATFIGTLPCADCPGIRYQLNLNADHTFTSRMDYEERNTSFSDSGRWEFSADGKALVLHGGHGATEKYALRVVETLRKLDSDGNEINSKFNYELERAPEFATLGAGGAATLENTSWKLTALDNRSVSAPSPQREAYFLLDPANHWVSGSGGCNRLAGSYKLDGDRLKFGQIAGTMMACPEGMDTEQAFLKSLGQVTTWKIAGQSLELFDSDGKVLAQFKVREN